MVVVQINSVDERFNQSGFTFLRGRVYLAEVIQRHSELVFGEQRSLRLFFFYLGFQSALGYEEIRFQLGYELNHDEIWKIDNFVIPQEICSALEYPDTIDLYSPADKTGLTADGYAIKCLFMGEIIENKPRIVFQRFEQSQIFKRKRPSIIYKGNIFTQNNDFCLNLLERPDAIYYDGVFKFIN